MASSKLPLLLFALATASQGGTIFYAGNGTTEQSKPGATGATFGIFTDFNRPAQSGIGTYSRLGIASAGGLGAYMTTSSAANSSIVCFPECVTGDNDLMIAGLLTDQLYLSGSLSIPVSATLKLSGSMAGSATGPDDSHSQIVAVVLTVNGNLMFGQYDRLDQYTIVENSSGMLSGFTGSTFSNRTFHSPTFLLQPGANTLRLELWVAAATSVTSPNASTPGVAASSSQALFHNTLTFNDQGPVFSGLPTGTTINALEIGIADNQFNPVPEPATYGMLAAAALCLWARPKRWRPELSRSNP